MRAESTDETTCPTCGQKLFDIPAVVRIKSSLNLMRHVGREPASCACPTSEHYVSQCCGACRCALRAGRGVPVDAG